MGRQVTSNVAMPTLQRWRGVAGRARYAGAYLLMLWP